MRSLGATVRRWREERGWEQRELAERAKLNPSYISRLEAAQWASPSVQHMVKISSAFGRPLSDLLTDAGMEVAPRSRNAIRDAIVNLTLSLSAQGREEALEMIELIQIREQRRQTQDRERAAARWVEPANEAQESG